MGTEFSKKGGFRPAMQWRRERERGGGVGVGEEDNQDICPQAQGCGGAEIGER